LGTSLEQVNGTVNDLKRELEESMRCVADKDVQIRSSADEIQRLQSEGDVLRELCDGQRDTITGLEAQKTQVGPLNLLDHLLKSFGMNEKLFFLNKILNERASFENAAKGFKKIGDDLEMRLQTLQGILEQAREEKEQAENRIAQLKDALVNKEQDTAQFKTQVQKKTDNDIRRRPMMAARKIKEATHKIAVEIERPATINKKPPQNSVKLGKTR